MIPQQKNKCKRFFAITENRLNIFAERKTFTLALYLEHIRDSLFKRRIGKLPSQYYFLGAISISAVRSFFASPATMLSPLLVSIS